MSDAVDTFNGLEIVLWLSAALACVWLALNRAQRRKHAWVANALFALFALSDVIELHTGAWWRPWWLLAWKGGCLGGLLWIGWQASRRQAQ
jgi:hypothetical protein